jgi:hypothetical protein
MPAGARTSYPLERALNAALAEGQLGGHVKRGVTHPKGKRTGKTMALVSALPLAPGSDQLVMTFMDRSDPRETFDQHPERGDNAVLIVPKSEVHLSVINGVCPGDWKGMKVKCGEPIAEPLDLDIDNTGMDAAASDRWVDLVDELGCDCSKLGGFPLWANIPPDIERQVGRPVAFHHRLTADLVDFKIGDGAVIYVFTYTDGEPGGCMCWQQARY